MSTQINHYVILGTKLPHDEKRDLSPFWDSAYDPAQPGEYVVLDDGMNGKFHLAGKVIAVSDEGEPFAELVELPTETKTYEKNEVSEWLRANLGAGPWPLGVYVVSYHR